MNNIDKRILRLIELLKNESQISSYYQFCNEIGMLKQTITKIKNGTAHFTVLQIESICKKYNVNANWIFGIEKNVFNNSKSIEIADVF